MDTYTIYILYDKEGKSVDIQYIPEGWSFWGMLFGPLWLLYHALVRPLFFYFAVLILIAQLAEADVVAPIISSVMMLVLSILTGFFGRDYIRAKLVREGYKFDDVIIASSEEEAQLKYVTKYLNLNASNG